MRDVNIIGFSVESDHVIRFRLPDSKVDVGDLLVGFGMYKVSSVGQNVIFGLIERNDEKVTCLESLEIDKTLIESQKGIILMNFRDVIKYFNSIGVRAINDVVMTCFDSVYGDVEGVDVDLQACVFDSMQTVPSSSLVLSSDCFVVPSMNFSMYWKKMRHVTIIGVSVQNDCVIRFRRHDNKVVVGDLLVGFGENKKSSSAHHYIFKMIEHRDDSITCLKSLEIDKTLVDGGRMILMNFQDFVRFFNSIGVRAINNAVMGEFERVHELFGGSENGTFKINQSLSNYHTIRTRLELDVRNAIDTAFKGFTHNKVMYSYDYGHRRRIDHRLLIGHTILAIETDENAHVSYKYEDERYEDFLKTFSYKFVFVRFNPHANKEEEGTETDFQHKLRILLHTITTQINRIKNGLNVSKLEIVKLFY